MIREMSEKGMKTGKIAEELGISMSTVRKYLRGRNPVNTAQRTGYQSLRNTSPA